MEYLMTYGWALLVIVIAIGVLLILNPFKASQQCIFEGSGLACNQPSNPIIGTGGVLYMTLTNGMQNSILVKDVICTASREPQTAPATPMFAINITAQGSAQFNDTMNKVYCTDVNGGTSFTKGSDFSGKLWVWYKNKDDPSGYPDRQMTANIVSKIE
jgi:hypothetical protein